MTQQTVNFTPDTLPAFKAVLWDMDGTLVNSDILHAKCIKQIGLRFGHVITDEICSRALGVSHRHCYDLLTAELGPMPISFEEWMQTELALYNASVNEIDPRDNVMDIIASLAQRGIKQAIFSNNPRHVIDMTTKGFNRFLTNPTSIFETIISLDEVPAKPDPQGYILAAQRLGVEPSECLVIEDSPTGVRAGKAAGCFTIFWPEKPESIQRLTVQPDLITHDLGALLLQ